MRRQPAQPRGYFPRMISDCGRRTARPGHWLSAAAQPGPRLPRPGSWRLARGPVAAQRAVGRRRYDSGAMPDSRRARPTIRCLIEDLGIVLPWLDTDLGEL